MTSATLIYSPPTLMRFPPKKTGVTGAPYTTIESYIAQTTITVRVIFDGRAIYNSSKFRSVQLVLTAGPH